MTIDEMKEAYNALKDETASDNKPKWKQLEKLITSTKKGITGEPTPEQYELLIAWQKEILSAQDEKRKSLDAKIDKLKEEEVSLRPRGNTR